MMPPWTIGCFIPPTDFIRCANLQTFRNEQPFSRRLVLWGWTFNKLHRATFGCSVRSADCTFGSVAAALFPTITRFKGLKKTEGSPLGTHIIAGYSPHFIGGKFGVDYNKGAPSIPMPRKMATLPMSLRQVAIELHTGRLYTFFGSGSVLYIFIIGLGILWCLWTGKKIMKK